MTVAIPRAPDYVNACNCSLCSKLGTVWAYFSPGEVTVTGEAAAYLREDLDERFLRTAFCPVCSAVSHWSPLDPGYGRMGVNVRLFPRDILAGIELRFGDRRHHDRGEHYARAPITLDDQGNLP